MSHTNRLFTLCSLLLILVAAPPAHGAVIGLDFTGGIGVASLTNRPRTNGYIFELTETKQVNALGFWDEGADGLVALHDVTLWDENGVQLATVIVDDSSTLVASTSTDGDWRFEDLISPVILNPGFYVVGGGLPSGLSDTVRTSIGSLVLSTATFVTLPANAPNDLNPGRNGPGNEGTATFPSTQNSNVVLGPNVLFADAIVVPEPASATLLTLAISAIAVRRRQRG